MRDLHPLNHEVRYRLLSYLAAHPDATQRELAQELGISLGKANYCLKAVIEKGWIKARNFRNSRKKSAYLYVLTPAGLEEKVNVTAAFLRRKLAEYELLSAEIRGLRQEVGELGPPTGADETA
jgi:EPS-associated MarR family transcriptional regulator